MREQHRQAWSCISARSVLFSSAMCAESPAGTEDVRQAGLSNGSGYGGKSCGDGRQNRQTRGTDGAASAECASGTGKRGTALPRGLFLFSNAGVQLNLSRTRAAHCKRACRMAASTAENPAEAGGRPARPAARTAHLLPSARSNTSKRGAASPRGQFCFQARTFAESPADTSGAQQAGLSKDSGHGGKPRGGGRAARPAARTARLLPSARVTPASVELHCRAVSFVFKRGRSAESPADTSGALQASLSKDSRYGGKSCGDGRAVQRARRTLLRVWAARLLPSARAASVGVSCTSARSVLFSSADVR